MRSRGVVFDLDGTLLDNMALHAEAFAIFMARHGLSAWGSGGTGESPQLKERARIHSARAKTTSRWSGGCRSASSP